MGVVKFISSQAFIWGAIFLAVYSFCYHKLDWKNAAKTDGDRNDLLDALKRNKARRFYRSKMRGLLRRIDNRLSNFGPERPSLIARSFNAGLLNFTMLTALIYPVVSGIVQWIFGSPILYGSDEILETGSPLARSLVAIWFLILIFQTVRLAFANYASRTSWFFPASTLLLVLVVGQIIAQLHFDVPEAFFFVFVLAFSGPYAFALVYIFAMAFVFDGAIVFSAHLAFALAFFSHHVESRNGGKIGKLVLLLVLFIATDTLVRTSWQPHEIYSSQAKYLVVFLGILPIFNAVFDFLSFGLTRFFIRLGLHGNVTMMAVYDFIAGIAIFFTLGFILIWYFNHLHLPDGMPLWDVAALFAELEANPQHYWWLLIILLSTLLPTFLHVLVGILTIAIFWPPFIRSFVAHLLAQGATIPWQGKLAGVFLSAMAALTFTLPTFLLYLLLFVAWDGAWIHGLIGIFKGFAVWIGAVPAGAVI